jgi:hypothetical protein
VSPTCCVNELNSIMSLPVASEKSGMDRSGIEGRDKDGNAGMAGIMSRADFVMESILLGAASSALANCKLAIIAAIKKSALMLFPRVARSDHQAKSHPVNQGVESPGTMAGRLKAFLSTLAPAGTRDSTFITIGCRI